MPSEKILAAKQQAVAELTDKIKGATAGVIVNYSGITVADDTAMRAALRKAGFVDGEVLDKAGVEELAAIPPKPILIGKMLGSLQKSLYGLAYVLQAKIDKENGGAEAPAEA